MTEQIPSYSREEYEKTEKELKDKDLFPASEKVKIAQKSSNLEDLAWSEALGEDVIRTPKERQSEQAKEKAEKLPVKVEVTREEDKNATSEKEEQLKEFMLEYGRLSKELQESINKERRITSEDDPKNENYDSLLGFLTDIEVCMGDIYMIGVAELGISEVRENPELLKRQAPYFMQTTPIEPIRKIASDVKKLRFEKNNNKTYGKEVIDRITGFVKFYQKSPKLIKQVLKDHQEIVIEQLNAEIKKIEPLIKVMDLHDKRFKALNNTLEQNRKNHEKLKESIRKFDETPSVSSILVKTIEHTMDLERQIKELKEKFPDIDNTSGTEEVQKEYSKEEAQKEYSEAMRLINEGYVNDHQALNGYYPIIENIKRVSVGMESTNAVDRQHQEQIAKFEQAILSRRKKGFLFTEEDMANLESIISYYRASLRRFRAYTTYHVDEQGKKLTELLDSFESKIKIDEVKSIRENEKKLNALFKRALEIRGIYPDIDKPS